MRKLCILALLGLAIGTSAGRDVPSGAAADLVLGQSDFVSNGAASPPTASSFNFPRGIAIDRVSGKIFISDSSNHRILRFANTSALSNGAPAELVIGQIDLTSNNPGVSSTALSGPAGIALDGAGNLWVADALNNRVLLFRAASTISNHGPAADLVLGQPDFNSNSVLLVPDEASMAGPIAVATDPSGRLWVADSGNNRILEFENAANLGNGAPANGVLGQATFTTRAPGTDQLGLDSPRGVTVDATGTLWVTDGDNHRIFGYPSAATISNGTNAARVLGQPDFNSNTFGLSASRVTSPFGLLADAENSLWVLDQGNSRILRFTDLASINNGSPASVVVGQSTFESGLPGLSPTRVDRPTGGIAIDSLGNLWVTDSFNNRVLRFATEDSEVPVVKIRGRKRFSTRRSRLRIRGSATDDTAVTLVTVKARKKRPRPAIGTTNWKFGVRIGSKRNVYKAFAFDAAGKRSRPAKVVILQK